MQLLTVGPSFPGKPCIPFFPWGPFKTKKISQLITNSASQSVKSNKKCLAFSPGSPTNPWGPGKPCRKDVSLVFMCMHSEDLVIFLWVSAHTRIPGLPCCPGAPISPGGPCYKHEIRSLWLICHHTLLSTTFIILTMFPFEPWTPSIPRIPCEGTKEHSKWMRLTFFFCILECTSNQNA